MPSKRLRKIFIDKQNRPSMAAKGRCVNTYQKALQKRLLYARILNETPSCSEYALFFVLLHHIDYQKVKQRNTNYHSK